MPKHNPNSVDLTMHDGRTVTFTAAAHTMRQVTIEADGHVHCRIDFRTGETRSFDVRGDMLHKFAAYGVDKKFCGVIANENGQGAGNPLAAVDELIEQLGRNQWTKHNGAEEYDHCSMLAIALCEVYGKTPAEIKTFLATQTMAQKKQLRKNPLIRPTLLAVEIRRAGGVKAALKKEIEAAQPKVLAKQPRGL